MGAKNKEWKKAIRERGANESLEVLVDRKAREEKAAKVKEERESFLQRIQENEEISEEIRESVKKQCAMRNERLENEKKEETRRSAYAKVVQKKIEEAEGVEER